MDSSDFTLLSNIVLLSYDINQITTYIKPELNQVLMNELYCSYDPSFEGKTSAEWLEWLQNTIQQRLKQLVIVA